MRSDSIYIYIYIYICIYTHTPHTHSHTHTYIHIHIPELFQLFQDDLVSNRILATSARISLPEFRDDNAEEID